MNKLVLTLAIGALFCVSGLFATDIGKTADNKKRKADSVLNGGDEKDKIKENKKRLEKRNKEKAEEKAANEKRLAEEDKLGVSSQTPIRVN